MEVGRDPLADARHAEEAGDYDLAAQHWQKIRQQYPGRPEGYVYGTHCLRRLDRLIDAAALACEGAEKFPDNESMRVEYAWVLLDRGQWAQCQSVCADLRIRYPDNLGAYLAGALACRRTHQYEAAESIYAEAMRRFAVNLELHLNFAWCAQERGDDAESLRRWRRVCEMFPTEMQGPVQLASVLSAQRQFDAADKVLVDAMVRMQASVELLTAYAWVAHDRGDWAVALRRWEALITHGGSLREARFMAAEALNFLGRYGEAAQVLAPALRIFPDDEALVVLNAWLATRRRDVPEAQRLWHDVRFRFPAVPDGFRGEAWALREVGQLDEADRLYADGLQVFPDNLELLTDHALCAERRPDWDEAAKRWRQVVTSCPRESSGPIQLTASLLKGRHLDDASAVVEQAIRQFPGDLRVASLESDVAAARKDWKRALRVWSEIERRFPNDARGAVGVAHALRESGDLAEAEQSLSESLRRFPGSMELDLQRALTLSARRRWTDALPAWALLAEHFPGNPQVKWGIGQIIDQALLDHASIGGFEIPPALMRSADEESADIKELAILLNRFESLGASCEFAMVQRLFNVNNLSLLRWADTPPNELIAALNDDLKGVGDTEFTRIKISEDEYVTEDTRYFMHSHTFTSARAEPLESFSVEQCRRIQWLRRRFIAERRSSDRICVYAHRSGLTGNQITCLHDALLRYNPSNVLLVVQLQTTEHPAGTLSHLAQGVFVGYIDRFSTIDISVQGWISLCRQVASKVLRQETQKAQSH